LLQEKKSVRFEKTRSEEDICETRNHRFVYTDLVKAIVHKYGSGPDESPKTECRQRVESNSALRGFRSEKIASHFVQKVSISLGIALKLQRLSVNKKGCDF
jgi:hypothetical protein